MKTKVVAYARAKEGEHEALEAAMQHFADMNGLVIVEQFIEQGHTSDAWAAAFRRVSTPGENYALLVPALSALGESRREVRGRMGGLRGASVPLYEMEGGMVITWTPAQIQLDGHQPQQPLQERNA